MVARITSKCSRRKKHAVNLDVRLTFFIHGEIL